MLSQSFTRSRRLAFTRCFSTQEPKPEDGQVDRPKMTEQNKRFSKLIKKEVLPLALLAFAAIAYFQYKTQVQNALLGTGRFGLEAMSKNDERFVAKRLAGFLKYTYSIGKQSLGPDLIEVQLV